MFIRHARQLLIAFLFLFSFSEAANAVLPDSGWWWNASQGGRGYAIEIQDNQIFFAAFTYDANGFPIWYYSNGAMTGDSYYSGRVEKVSNGTCFGCAQIPSQNTDSGAMTIDFTGTTSATLTILGFSTPIARFDFDGGNNITAPNACYGEWAAVIGDESFPVYFGERMSFFAPYVGSDGTQYLSGNRAGEFGANNFAVCSYSSSTGYWAVLIDSSTSYYEFFYFKFTGFNRMEGTEYTYLKGSSPINGSNFVAFRTASKSFVQGLGGPATAKSSQRKSNYSAIPASLQLAEDKRRVELAAGNRPILPMIQDVVTKMEAAFPRAK